MDHLGVILGHFGSFLGHFGSFWVTLGPCWAILGQIWAILGHIWATLGRFWAISWHIWKNLRKVQIFLRDSWGPNPRFLNVWIYSECSKLCTMGFSSETCFVITLKVVLLKNTEINHFLSQHDLKRCEKIFHRNIYLSHQILLTNTMGK